MGFTFIKLPRHRKFNIDPIYYDATKEERKERERNIRIELGLKPLEEEEGQFKNRIKGKMRSRLKGNFELTRSARKKSNLRLIIILIALIALFYYLLHAGYDWYSQFL